MLFQLIYSVIISAIDPYGEIVLWVRLLLSQLFCFILPSILYLKLTSQRISYVIRAKPLDIVNVLYIIFLSLLIQPVAMLLSLITNIIFPNNIAEILINMQAETNPIIVVIIMCIIPSVCEEIAIRGIAAKDLDNYTPLKAAILNGIYFAIIHLNPQQFFYAFALGMVLYFMLEISDSIIAPILAHFTINLSQTLVLFGLSPTQSTDSVQIIHIFIIIFILLISFSAFIILFKAFINRNKYRIAENMPSVSIINFSFIIMIAVYMAIIMVLLPY